MTHDDFIEGTFDYWNPTNSEDYKPEQNEPETISEYITLGKTDKVYDLIGEVIKEVQQLRELCKQTNKDGNKDFLINKLTKIYSKL